MVCIRFGKNKYFGPILEQMWKWVKVQPNREIKTFENIELTEGLYDFWK